MPARWASLVYLISAAAVIAFGLRRTSDRIRQATRAYRTASRVHASMPEGWGGWFLHGFSTVTAGTTLLRAWLVGATWMVLGAVLAVAGLRFVW